MYHNSVFAAPPAPKPPSPTPLSITRSKEISPWDISYAEGNRYGEWVPLMLTAEAALPAKGKTHSRHYQSRKKSKAATAKNEIVESGVEEGEEHDHEGGNYSY